jgi:uncharacterized Zn ribbon protein
MVRQALRDRPARDVSLMSCPKCNRHGYYNDGSHFYCRHCDVSFDALTENEIVERAEDWNASSRPYVACDDAVSAEDLWDAEFDNQHQAFP